MKDLNALLDELDALMRAGDRNAIETWLTGLLTELELAGRTSSQEYITLLSELAGWYRGISRYSESENCYSRVLGILEENHLENTTQYARLLLNEAGLYRLMGRFEESLADNFKARGIIENSSQRDEYAFATVLNSLTLTYQTMGDFATADEIASESLAFVRTSSVADAHEIATALNNLASIRLRLDDLESAEELLREALALYDGMERENFHHGAALASMGAVLYRKSLFAEAIEQFQASCEATERFFGKNIEFASGQHNLALAYEAIGNYDSAISHQRLSEEITRGLLGAEHTRTQRSREYLDLLGENAASAQKGAN
jgi:tetratricopeptide (TPR) repeat protein